MQERVLEPTAAGGTAVDLFFHIWLQPGDPLEAAGIDAIRTLPRVVASVEEDPSRRGELTERFFNDSRLFKEAQAAEEYAASPPWYSRLYSSIFGGGGGGGGAEKE